MMLLAPAPRWLGAVEVESGDDLSGELVHFDRPLAFKDGSGAVSGRVSADFGFVGFGFGFQSSPADFRFRVPEKVRVWGGFQI